MYDWYEPVSTQTSPVSIVSLNFSLLNNLMRKVTSSWNLYYVILLPIVLCISFSLTAHQILIVSYPGSRASREPRYEATNPDSSRGKCAYVIATPTLHSLSQRCRVSLYLHGCCTHTTRPHSLTTAHPTCSSILLFSKKRKKKKINKITHESIDESFKAKPLWRHHFKVPTWPPPFCGPGFLIAT